MIVEIILCCLIAFLLHRWMTRPTGLPPGPFAFPFYGSGLAGTLKKVTEYHQRYGNVFRTEIFGVPFIYICDFKLIKEALGKFEFSDRPHFEGFHFLTDGKETGVIMSNGRRWSNARRFLLRNMRDLGMGKSYLDGAIVTEAKFLVEDFKNTAGKPTTIPDSINIAVLNVVWQLVASRRYDLRDEEIHEFIRLTKSLQEDSMGWMLLQMCPRLAKVLPQFVKNKIFSVEKLQRTIKATKRIFGAILEDRKAKLNALDPQNVIDEYLLQMDEKTDIAEFFDEQDLMKIIFDLFGAGFDTTSNMLRWLILYAAKYQKIQLRIQKQIDEVVPRGEIPTSLHRNKLPLVEAFIHETLRMSSLIPMGVMHSTNTDTTLAGYNIPKDSIILGVTGICHESTKYWKDPNTFNLERFLDEEGRFISHKEGFGPFGIGKRSCLGEPLARMELSIFGAALLQNFTFSAPKGKSIDLEPDHQPFVNFIKNQDVVITPRL